MFLMTPEPYLRHAEAMRVVGNEYLAQQFDNLYRLLDDLYRLRTGSWPPSPSIVPE